MPGDDAVSAEASAADVTAPEEPTATATVAEHLPVAEPEPEPAPAAATETKEALDPATLEPKGVSDGDALSALADLLRNDHTAISARFAVALDALKIAPPIGSDVLRVAAVSRLAFDSYDSNVQEFAQIVSQASVERPSLAAETQTKVTITGIDRALVGQIAANSREKRPPEPYKGKGIKYEGERIRRKAGKSAGA